MTRISIAGRESPTLADRLLAAHRAGEAYAYVATWARELWWGVGADAYRFEAVGRAAGEAFRNAEILYDWREGSW